MLPRNPVCVKCEKTLYPYHNGAYLVELYHNNEYVYKIWHSDIWACRKCEMKIVCGFGNKPIMTNVDGEEKCRGYIHELKKANCTIVYDYE